jgi:Tol biopolymer transport system component
VALADFPDPETPLEQGRLLFTIIWKSRSMPAYIDMDGLHLIPSPEDFTFASPVWAGPDAILFDSERAGNRHLFRANLDGTVTQITSGDTFEGSASVSPDGTMIVYENWTADNQDLGLHIAASDGSNPRSLTPALPVGAPGGDVGPSFSPDGQWIAFVRVASFADGQAGIFIVRIDGSGLRRLTPDALGAGYPRWSPDGTKILFSAKYPDGPSGGPLWVVSVDGGEPTPLEGTSLAEGDWAYEGDWSPDGTMIVYKYLPAGGRVDVIRLAKADGTNVVDLWSAGGTGVDTPDWGN